MTIAADLGIREIPYTGEKRVAEKDESNPSIVRDPESASFAADASEHATNIRALMSMHLLTADSILRTGQLRVWIRSHARYCGQCVAVCLTAICEKGHGKRSLTRSWRSHQACNSPDGALQHALPLEKHSVFLPARSSQARWSPRSADFGLQQDI